MSGFRRTLRRLASGHRVPQAKLDRLEARQRVAVVMLPMAFRMADAVYASANLSRITDAPLPDLHEQGRMLIGLGAIRTVAAVEAFGQRGFAAGAVEIALAASEFAAGAAMLGLPPSEPPPP